MMIIKKKAQSDIIGTILLILLAIVAFTVVAGVAYRIVNDKIESSECQDISTMMHISNKEHTCYHTGSSIDLQIKIEDIRNRISGIKISIDDGTSLKNFVINETDALPAGVTLKSGIPGSSIENLPEDDGALTYQIGGVLFEPRLVAINPIMKSGRLCDESDRITSIRRCS